MAVTGRSGRPIPFVAGTSSSAEPPGNQPLEKPTWSKDRRRHGQAIARPRADPSHNRARHACSRLHRHTPTIQPSPPLTNPVSSRLLSLVAVRIRGDLHGRPAAGKDRAPGRSPGRARWSRAEGRGFWCCSAAVGSAVRGNGRPQHHVVRSGGYLARVLLLLRRRRRRTWRMPPQPVTLLADRRRALAADSAAIVASQEARRRSTKITP